MINDKFRLSIPCYPGTMYFSVVFLLIVSIPLSRKLEKKFKVQSSVTTSWFSQVFYLLFNTQQECLCWHVKIDYDEINIDKMVAPIFF